MSTSDEQHQFMQQGKSNVCVCGLIHANPVHYRQEGRPVSIEQESANLRAQIVDLRAEVKHLTAENRALSEALVEARAGYRPKTVLEATVMTLVDRANREADQAAARSTEGGA